MSNSFFSKRKLIFENLFLQYHQYFNYNLTGALNHKRRIIRNLYNGFNMMATLPFNEKT